MKAGTYVLMIALAAPLALQAQQGQPAREVGPAERLLAHRAELSLTAEQVKKLEAMDAKLRQQDKEVLAKVEALRGKPAGEPLRMRDMAVAERTALQAKRSELQPLMQQLRTSHVQAAADVRAVLTPEQNARADAFLFNGPGQGHGRQGAWNQQGRGAGAGRASMRGRGGQGRRGGGAMMNHAGSGAAPRGGFGRGR